MPPIQPPKKPAAIPTIDPMRTPMSVAASPTRRLVRDPQMNCVSESRPRLSVPSGANSDGLAKAGFCVVLIALRPASSARSGAAIAIATAATRMARPIIPGVLRRYVAERAAERAPAPDPRDPAGRWRRDRVHDAFTRGSR